ncbi:unnamed protein product [Cylindrotheca closterium]|uniref:Uncharacterized protein n=1 Tax=Cylindrotheca closterium TaxID=2856 RepID=A0AAD2PXG1_9STRA|nr:unnamed protein product [Cylindrotheca closterium]
MASKSSLTYKRIRPTQQPYFRFFQSGNNKIQEESVTSRRLESLRYFHSSQDNTNGSLGPRQTFSTGTRWHSSNHRNRRGNNRRNNHRQEPSSSRAADRFQNHNRRDSKPSPATLLMDQWETSSSSSSGHQSSSYNANVQRKRFEERQVALCQAIVQYRNQWFEPDDSNIATEWKHAVQFQHPTGAAGPVTKQKLLETEELFGQICTLCHDFFVTTALLAESELTLSSTNDLDTKQKTQLQRQLQQQQDAIDILTTVLPFWETMRKDRAILVQQVLKQEPAPALTETNKELLLNDNPKGTGMKDRDDDKKSVPPPPEKQEEGGGKNWVAWIKSMVVGDGGSNDPSMVPVPSPSTPMAKKLEVSSLSAHDDVQFAPNHYHYNKLVGRLYFSYPPLVAFQAFQDEDDDLGQDLMDVVDEEDENDDDDDLDMDRRQTRKISKPQSLPDEDAKLVAILEQRASQIQRIFDQVPNTVPAGMGGSTVRSPVLTDKMVRLLIRAYQDTATLDAAYQTEQVYYRYPSHRRGLLWYVLMSYLQVTEKDPPPRSSSSGGENPDAMGFAQQLRKSPKKFSPKSASLATKRVCELLSKQVQQSNMNPNELHSCATIGFQCLANIAVPSLDRYYDRVHALATLKFGAKTWEALLSSKPNIETLQQQLRPKDSVSIQLLIQIFAKSDGAMMDAEDVRMEKAKDLLDNMWKCYSISELQDSIERSTFHSLLDALNKRRKRKKKAQDVTPFVRTKTGETVFDNHEDFDYALTLFDKMVTHEVWYPNEETFHHLYRLAEYGPQADEVSIRLELCRAILQEYPLSPYLASKHALRAWSDTAEKRHLVSEDKSPTNDTFGVDDETAAVAMERAFQIFQQLQMYSSPLLYQNAPQKISHVYNVNDVPTSLSYGLVWQTCYSVAQNASAATKKRAVEIATAMYRLAEQKEPRTELRPKSHRMFLQCLSLSTNDQERLEFAQDVFTKARQTNNSSGSGSGNRSSSSGSASMEPLLLEALLDCLVNPTTASTTQQQQQQQQQRQELIEQVYNEVVSAHDMPVMSDRFLTLLGRVHPELHKRHISDHHHQQQQQQQKKE